MVLSRGNPKNDLKLAKIVFFGTDEFAAATLEALVNTGTFKIVSVVTQPDRPMGRKQEMEPPPVKIVAEKYGIKVEQPESLKNYSLPPTPYSLNLVYRYGQRIYLTRQNVSNAKHGFDQYRVRRRNG